MEQLIDQEYLDPEWPENDPNYDIFNTYGFAKLADKTIQEFVATTCTVPDPTINVIGRRFSVIYDYSYRAWIEQRQLITKTKSRSSDSDKKSESDSTSPSSMAKNLETIKLNNHLFTNNENLKKAVTIHKSDSPTINEKLLISKKDLPDKWQYDLCKIPPAFIKESSKNIPIFHTLVECSTCKGRGVNQCDNCNSTGFMKCPQCRGIGVGGRSITGMSKNMTKGGFTSHHCSRCHSVRTVPCTKCGGNFQSNLTSAAGDLNKCYKCKGKKNLRTDHTLKVSWLNHEDRVVVGQHTKSIPKQDILDSFGVEVQEWSSQPLQLDICPDRPDLVDLSTNNYIRLANLVPGKIREHQHKLRALPLCMATVEIIENNNRFFQNFYIIGSINCKLCMGKRINVGLDKVKSKSKGWGKVRSVFNVK